jgi:hypothetical protein
MNYQIFELNKDKPTHLIYKVKNYQNNDNLIEPILELYKGKLFTCLIKFFTNDCINIFGVQIFSIKKSYFRTLTNILSSWMFSLYIDYNYSSNKKIDIIIWVATSHQKLDSSL